MTSACIDNQQENSEAAKIKVIQAAAHFGSGAFGFGCSLREQSAYVVLHVFLHHRFRSSRLWGADWTGNTLWFLKGTLICSLHLSHCLFIKTTHWLIEILLYTVTTHWRKLLITKTVDHFFMQFHYWRLKSSSPFFLLFKRYFISH